jgi:hypothetical protein
MKTIDDVVFSAERNLQLLNNTVPQTCWLAFIISKDIRTRSRSLVTNLKKKVTLRIFEPRTTISLGINTKAFSPPLHTAVSMFDLRGKLTVLFSKYL